MALREREEVLALREAAVAAREAQLAPSGSRRRYSGSPDTVSRRQLSPDADFLDAEFRERLLLHGGWPVPPPPLTHAAVATPLYAAPHSPSFSAKESALHEATAALRSAAARSAAADVLIREANAAAAAAAHALRRADLAAASLAAERQALSVQAAQLCEGWAALREHVAAVTREEEERRWAKGSEGGSGGGLGLFESVGLQQPAAYGSCLHQAPAEDVGSQPQSRRSSSGAPSPRRAEAAPHPSPAEDASPASAELRRQSAQLDAQRDELRRIEQAAVEERGRLEEAWSQLWSGLSEMEAAKELSLRIALSGVAVAGAGLDGGPAPAPASPRTPRHSAGDVPPVSSASLARAVEAVAQAGQREVEALSALRRSQEREHRGERAERTSRSPLQGGC